MAPVSHAAPAALSSPPDWRRTMSELDARYARGQDTRRMFGGGTIRNAGSVPGAWDVAPDLERILGEALFGTIWRRDTLSPVQREMITWPTLIVLAREPQLPAFCAMKGAMHRGLNVLYRALLQGVYSLSKGP